MAMTTTRRLYKSVGRPHHYTKYKFDYQEKKKNKFIDLVLDLNESQGPDLNQHAPTPLFFLDNMHVEPFCDTPIWLIVWCVWVCDESHIGYLLGRSGLY